MAAALNHPVLIFKEELNIENQNQKLPRCHLFVPWRRPGCLEKRDGEAYTRGKTCSVALCELRAQAGCE